MSKKKYSTAYKLFNKFYTISIPGYALAEYEMNKYGYRRAGADSTEDKHLAEREVTIRASLLTEGNRKIIPCIAELNEAGVEITLSKVEDAVDIYEVIKEHLRGWMLYLESNSVLPGNLEEQQEVINDLIMLDKLQIKIYKMASRYLKDSTEGSFLNNRLFGSRSRNLRRSTVEMETTRTDTTYKPVSMDLKKQFLRRTKQGF